MEQARGTGGQRWFFLAGPAGEGPARLEPDDERHAREVLRLRAGAELVATDGAGHVWPLVVADAGRKELVLAPRGEIELVPRAGETGSEVASIEVAVCAPKGARAEEMLDRLVQLGVDRLTLLLAERSQGFDRERVEQRLERWRRIAREACKQAHRAWLPELRGPQGLDTALAEPRADLEIVLSPRAERTLARSIARSIEGGRIRRVRVFVGPEGGWSTDEEARLRDFGATEASIGPHVLRVETAAEAAAAILVHASWRAI